MPPPLFGRNEFNPDVKVEKLFSGFFFGTAVTSGGDLYSWGRNEAGCLGLGLDDGIAQYFPLKVNKLNSNIALESISLHITFIKSNILILLLGLFERFRGKSLHWSGSHCCSFQRRNLG